MRSTLITALLIAGAPAFSAGAQDNSSARAAESAVANLSMQQANSAAIDPEQVQTAVRPVADNPITNPLATSSPDISRQIAGYLDLDPAQIAAIQAEISADRRQVQPLLDQLDKNRRELIANTLNGKYDVKQVEALAAAQSRILRRLIVANTLLETKLYRILTSEQRRKVDELRRVIMASGKASFPVW